MNDIHNNYTIVKAEEEPHEVRQISLYHRTNDALHQSLFHGHDTLAEPEPISADAQRCRMLCKAKKLVMPVYIVLSSLLDFLMLA